MGLTGRGDSSLVYSHTIASSSLEAESFQDSEEGALENSSTREPFMNSAGTLRVGFRVAQSDEAYRQKSGCEGHLQLPQFRG